MVEGAIVGTVQVNTSETIRGIDEDRNIGSTSYLRSLEYQAFPRSGNGDGNKGHPQHM